MARYSVEKKEWILRQMMAPLNRPISELAEETGIHVVTLYSWRRKARESGVVMPGNGKGSDDWSSAEKFRVVLETMTLSETELSEYCRSKGLYPEQVAQWREACEKANDQAESRQQYTKEKEKQSARRIKELERELKRKEAALAEAAALIILKKKANAIWGDGEDD
jgi:transposase-like protein